MSNMLSSEQLLESTYISDGVKGNKSRLREWSAHHLSFWFFVIKKWTQSWIRYENIAGKQNNFIRLKYLIATESEVPISMIRDFPCFERTQPFSATRSFPSLSTLSLSLLTKKNLVTSIVFLRSKVFREPFNITGPNQRITWSGLHPRLHLSTSTHPYIHPPILASVRYAAWSGDARARVGPCGSPCLKAPWMI